jgi:uncharacterized protein YpuA (DUF1002 family)
MKTYNVTLTDDELNLIRLAVAQFRRENKSIDHTTVETVLDKLDEAQHA